MKKILFVAVLAIWPMAVLADINPARIATVTTIAVMQAGDFTNTLYVQALGYNSTTDNGGGLFQQNGTSCSPDSVVIFKDSAGNCFYRLRGGVEGIPVTWAGVYANAKTAADGVANGSATFTSASAQFSSADIGKTIVIMGKPGTANASFTTTIAAVGGPTSITLNSSIGWSDTGLTYWYGTNDFTAFQNAGKAAKTYGTYVTVPGTGTSATPLAYMISGAGGLSFGTSGTYANYGLVGIGRPILTFGNVGTSNNCITFGAYNESNQQFKHVVIEGNYVCGETFNWAAGNHAEIDDVWMLYPQNDCFDMNPVGSAGGAIQNGRAVNLICQGAGRHCFYADADNTSGTPFNNILYADTWECRGVSWRTAGGAAFYGNRAGFQSDNWIVSNFNADAQYGGSFQSTYAPAAAAFTFAAGSGNWGDASDPMTFTNWSTENTGGVDVPGASGAFKTTFASSALYANIIGTSGNSHWDIPSTGTIIGYGSDSAGNGGSITMGATQAFSVWNGVISITVDKGGGNSTNFQTALTANATGCNFSTLSTENNGTGATSSLGCSVTAGVATINIQNTSGATATISYALQGPAGPVKVVMQ